MDELTLAILGLLKAKQKREAQYIDDRATLGIMGKRGSATDVYESHSFRVQTARKPKRCYACIGLAVPDVCCRQKPLAGYRMAASTHKTTARRESAPELAAQTLTNTEALALAQAILGL